ncbi:cobalamin biosynthesis protein [Ectothiorhodospira lacustris]|uniref:cobalamin biosynthesis protein n=1 Tax=Ectothiorhodospira lacustris TaxID=2899127 RepID=UPI001EE79AD1|nr:cobalamin biosynthesis protein [Ectothiorhodospira lacustris]MCG5499699.1 cobalamin biosynthesis protein [Ectothiorhodospira lacustris]MCG5509105.1 cobalamin biosynthesis protein [Ectothiorhodospira lacustris]MCG5520896.1 cobalamin biosynthesis protein [Ectothiorhodospira lacustris]
MKHAFLGVGCTPGLHPDAMMVAVHRALEMAALAPDAVGGLGTIVQRRHEPAILFVAKHHGWNIQVFSAQTLSQVPVPNPSERVRQIMGTPAVAEAAALLAAGTRDPSHLLLEKLIHRDGAHKAATISIARQRSHAKAPHQPL